MERSPCPDVHSAAEDRPAERVYRKIAPVTNKALASEEARVRKES